jgi:hypothetical protein
MRFREGREIVLSEGEETPFGSLIDIDSDIPDRILIIGNENQESMKRVVAKLSDGGEEVNIGIFPFRLRKGKFFHVADLGVSPDIRIEKAECVIHLREMKLLPPGSEVKEKFNGCTVIVRLSPERTFKKGRLTASEFDLTDPFYDITFIDEHGQKIIDAVMKSGSAYKGEGVSLSVSETKEWVSIMIVNDPFLYFLYTGFLLIFIGTALYPLQIWRRRIKDKEEVSSGVGLVQGN